METKDLSASDALEAVESGDLDPRDLLIALSVEQLVSVRPDITYEILAQSGIQPDDMVMIYQGSLIRVAHA